VGVAVGAGRGVGVADAAWSSRDSLEFSSAAWARDDWDADACIEAASAVESATATFVAT